MGNLHHPIPMAQGAHAPLPTTTASASATSDIYGHLDRHGDAEECFASVKHNLDAQALARAMALLMETEEVLRDMVKNLADRRTDCLEVVDYVDRTSPPNRVCGESLICVEKSAIRHTHDRGNVAGSGSARSRGPRRPVARAFLSATNHEIRFCRRNHSFAPLLVSIARATVPARRPAAFRRPSGGASPDFPGDCHGAGSPMSTQAKRGARGHDLPAEPGAMGVTARAQSGSGVAEDAWHPTRMSPG